MKPLLPHLAVESTKKISVAVNGDLEQLVAKKTKTQNCLGRDHLLLKMK
jgi:hypothetical protein